MSNSIASLTGLLSSVGNLEGTLSNITLRGEKVQLQVTDTTLQWKYESDTEWTDLIDINEIDYEQMGNLPTINGETMSGELSDKIVTPDDPLTNSEIQKIIS